MSKSDKKEPVDVKIPAKSMTGGGKRFQPGYGENSLLRFFTHTMGSFDREGGGGDDDESKKRYSWKDIKKFDKMRDDISQVSEQIQTHLAEEKDQQRTMLCNRIISLCRSFFELHSTANDSLMANYSDRIQDYANRQEGKDLKSGEKAQVSPEKMNAYATTVEEAPLSEEDNDLFMAINTSLSSSYSSIENLFKTYMRQIEPDKK
jgi:hypothetical protein